MGHFGKSIPGGRAKVTPQSGKLCPVSDRRSSTAGVQERRAPLRQLGWPSVCSDALFLCSCCALIGHLEISWEPVFRCEECRPLGPGSEPCACRVSVHTLSASGSLGFSLLCDFSLSRLHCAAAQALHASPDGSVHPGCAADLCSVWSEWNRPRVSMDGVDQARDAECGPGVVTQPGAVLSPP